MKKPERGELPGEHGQLPKEGPEEPGLILCGVFP